MAVTQAKAILYGQGLVALAQQFVSLRAQCLAMAKQKANNSYDTVYAAMPTAAFNTDGTLAPLDLTAGTGNVSAVQGSTTLTFVSSQSALTGTRVVLALDTTQVPYLVTGGSGTSWTIAIPYVGASVTCAFATLNPTIANPIVTPGSPPVYLLPGKTQLANLEAIIDAYLVFLDGSGATTQLNRNGNLDPVVG